MSEVGTCRTTRRRVLAGGAGVAGAVLAACGLGQQTSGAPAAGGQPVRLTYLHQWNQSQGHGPATEQLVARFSQEHPTIQVDAVFSDAYYEKLPTILAGGDFPDVITSNVETLPSIQRKQVSVSPESFTKGPERLNKNDMVPVSREMVTFDGKVAAVPYILSNLGTVYNQTLFRQRGLDPAKPPTTWNDVVEMGKQLKGGGGDVETFGMQMQRGTGNVPVLTWMCLLWQNGGQELDMQRRVATWNSPAGVEALQFWVDLIHRHGVVPVQQPPNPFQIGRAGFWFLPVGSVSIVQRAVQEQFQWTTAALPAGKQRASNVGGHTLVVLKTNKHHEQAWRFVHWFTSPQIVVEFNVPSVTLPPWQSAQQQPTWQRFTREQPWVKPFVDMLAYGRPPVKLITATDVLRVLGEGIEAALNLKQAPKQALDEAARTAESFIKEG